MNDDLRKRIRSKVIKAKTMLHYEDTATDEIMDIIAERERLARLNELQIIGSEGWSDEDSILAEYLDGRIAELNHVSPTIHEMNTVSKKRHSDTELNSKKAKEGV